MNRIAGPCQPYDLGPGRAVPVSLWAVLDRLTPWELRSLAVTFSVHDPRMFEDKLLRLWDERRDG